MFFWPIGSAQGGIKGGMGRYTPCEWNLGRVARRCFSNHRVFGGAEIGVLMPFAAGYAEGVEAFPVEGRGVLSFADQAGPAHSAQVVLVDWLSSSPEARLMTGRCCVQDVDRNLARKLPQAQAV